MNQEIIFDSEARVKLKAGVDKLANLVKVTLGARGRNVIIDNGYDSPQITKDGVTCARSVNLSDPIENMGARLVKDVAAKTNDQAGDGTTTATVLAQSIYVNGLKYLTSGSNPMDLKRGIDKAVIEVVKKLKELSQPIGDLPNIKNIATISANGDDVIGTNISEAIRLVSKDGVITIEESSTSETSVEVVEGMQFAKGFMSPYFVTDTAKMEVVLNHPFVLLCPKRVSLAREFTHALEMSLEHKRPLLIIADEIDSEALQILIINKVKGNLQVAAVKSPNYGNIRKEMMEDLAALTGGVVMDENIGLLISDVTIDQLGQIDKVIITQNITTIIGGKGGVESIDKRVEIIRKQIDAAPSEFDKERVRERLAKMAGGIAIISVGGSSEVEMRERKDRFDDALNATRAAISEGIIPGGGIALLRCINALEGIRVNNEDEALGVKIVAKAIQEPFMQILRNAGMPAEVWYNTVMSVDRPEVFDTGVNVATGKLEMFLETGVIDPTKVTRVALENAASVSGLLLTTEAVVYNIKEKEISQDV